MKKIILKKKIVLLSSYVLVGLLMFSLVEAACPDPIGGIEPALGWATCILMSSVIPLLITLAMAGFIYGVITFYLNPTNEEKRKSGKSFIVGGLIALFVIVSMWGLVGILTNTFMDTGPAVPTLEGITY